MDVVSKDAARSVGQTWFFTGEPCKNGHIDKRSVKNGVCFACRREGVRRHAHANREEINRKANARYYANHEENKAKFRAHHAANRDRLNAVSKAYYEKNREGAKAKSRARHHANRDRLNANARARYYAHQEERKAKQRAYHHANIDDINRKARLRYRDNPERWKSVHRAWCEANAEARREQAFNARRRRRAREVGAEGSFTRADVLRILKEQGGLCVYCDRDLTDGAFHADHKTPLSRGGDNTAANIQVLCVTCNQSKHAKTHEEYVEWRARILG